MMRSRSCASPSMSSLSLSRAQPSACGSKIHSSPIPARSSRSCSAIVRCVRGFVCSFRGAFLCAAYLPFSVFVSFFISVSVDLSLSHTHTHTHSLLLLLLPLPPPSLLQWDAMQLSAGDGAVLADAPVIGRVSRELTHTGWIDITLDPVAMERELRLRRMWTQSAQVVDPLELTKMCFHLRAGASARADGSAPLVIFSSAESGSAHAARLVVVNSPNGWTQCAGDGEMCDCVGWIRYAQSAKYDAIRSEGRAERGPSSPCTAARFGTVTGTASTSSGICECRADPITSASTGTPSTWTLYSQQNVMGYTNAFELSEWSTTHTLDDLKTFAQERGYVQLSLSRITIFLSYTVLYLLCGNHK